MKHLITLLFLLIFQIGYSQDFIDLSGKWSTNTFPNFKYEFDSLGNVRFDWINDIGSFHRKGKYIEKADTVIIDFEPLIKSENLSDSSSDNLSLFFCDKNKNKLPYYKVQVIYSTGKKLVVETDTNGIVLLSRMEKIDSIMLDHNYSNLAPELRNPKVNNPNFYNSFYSLKIDEIECDSVRLIVDHWLMGSDFKSNRKKILRISRDKIYNEINYDPNVIYVGGILTKE